MIRLQLYINGELHTEFIANRPNTQHNVIEQKRILFERYRQTIGNRRWDIYLVLQSKINGHLEEYAREGTEVVALTKTRAA